MNIISQIYLFSFFSFISFSILGNLFFSSVYQGCTIGITYIIFLILSVYFIDRRKFLEVFMLFGGVSIFSFIVLYWIKDGSWDGNTYHLEIIQKFIGGQSFFSKETIEIWSHVYPKNMELLLSIFSSFTPLYTDTGRIIKMIIFMITCMSLFDFLMKLNFSKRQSLFWVLFLVILHPLILAQFFTKYIDDMLYCFFILAIIAFLQRNYVIYLLIFALFIGSKLNYVLYVIISMPFLFYVSCILDRIFWRDKFREILSYFSSIKKSHLFFYITLFFLLSSYIYLINLVNYQNPFFPLFGSGKTEVVANNLPVNLVDVSKFYAHIVSLFGYSLSDHSLQAYIMNPFAPDFWSMLIKSYGSIDIDTRMAGFGSIWGVALFISIIHTFYVFFTNKQSRFIIVFAVITIFVILLLMPFAWARFIPFFYPIPFLISYFFVGRYRKFYMLCIGGLYIINILFYIIGCNGKFVVNDSIQNIVTNYYIKKHNIEIYAYYPGDISVLKNRKRASDSTQNEVYHIWRKIPIEKTHPCSQDNIQSLYNMRRPQLWIDYLHPRVVDCGNSNYIIGNRGYPYETFLIGRKSDE